MKKLSALLIVGLVASSSLPLYAQQPPQPRQGGGQAQGHGPQEQGPGPQGHEEKGQGGHQRLDHGSFGNGDQSHQYGPGQRLPEQFRGSDRFVDDYHSHNLSAPPHGYRWVRDDAGDFVLVAIATGIISQIVAHALIGH